MERILERSNLEGMMPSTTINNSNINTPRFPVRNMRKQAVCILGSNMAATKTATVQIKQAKDYAGTDEKNITGATVMLTANTNVTNLKVDISSAVADTDTVTINGVLYSYKALDNVDAREFKNEAGLIACLAADGLTDIATTTDVVFVRSSDGLTATSTANIVVTTPTATMIVEFSLDDLDDGYDYISANVATTDNTTFGAALIQSEGLKEPTPQMASSTLIFGA